MMQTRDDTIGIRERAQRAAGLLLVLCLLLARPAAAQVPPPPSCPTGIASADLISHLSSSYCELCGDGVVRIEVENPFAQSSDDVSLGSFVIREDLQASGLVYIPGSTVLTVNGVASPSLIGEPSISGSDDEALEWTVAPSVVLDAYNGPPSNAETLVLEFGVRRHASLLQEPLISASRLISAEVDATPTNCTPATPFTSSTGDDLLALEEPIVSIQKRGRNVDAGQTNWTQTIYGHTDDDIIWRIRVRNTGDAPLEDFKFDDTMAPDNFEIDQICDNFSGASSIATGAGSASGCVNIGPTTSISDFDPASVFGGGDPVAGPNDTAFFYLVGRVTASCDNRTNTVDGVEWGCTGEGNLGGITQSSTGSPPTATATLSTFSDENDVNVTVALTGEQAGDAMGGTGLVTITIANNSGGTIRGGASGLRIENLLPEEYVIDPSVAPTVSTTNSHPDYDGRIDTITWDNPQPGTYPTLTSTDVADYLANRDLTFSQTSSPPAQDGLYSNLIRHGDVVTVTFQTVLIDSDHYDRTAHLDVRPEDPGSTPADTDPAQTFEITNELDIQWEQFCTADVRSDNIVSPPGTEANPEDIDIDLVGGGDLIFVLNSRDTLDLSVNLTNNGGHVAEDYTTVVTFGAAMTVTSWPTNCADLGYPSLTPWQLPEDLPPSPVAIFSCTGTPIERGTSTSLDFEVVKTTGSGFPDDLSFRADVTGQITLGNGTPLWFPEPLPRADGITNPANDYSLDGLRARGIGYDLFKTRVGECSENNPPLAGRESHLEIGEECDYEILSGGWFGFETPGFDLIAVENIQVLDNVPDGQAYISDTDPATESTAAIKSIAEDPAATVLGQATFGWLTNTNSPADQITVKDHWFEVDVRTRLANDPVDLSGTPNAHAEISSNILTSTFDAIFEDDDSGSNVTFQITPSTLGYPREVHRQVDMTVTEPNLIVTKQVCNESLDGPGSSCGDFQDRVDDGDAFDTYVYRVTITNEASSEGVPRAPAYDVTVTSVTDPGDQLYVDPLTGDTLDNDGDLQVDASDTGGEGTITDNTVLNGTPAQIIASHQHSAALERIDPGDSVVLYYRVDPDDDVAPLQELRSTVTASYDSLTGDFGNQSAPQVAAGLEGGARRYTSAEADAIIQIVPVEARPKSVIDTANTALVTSPATQGVSIGEEVEFELFARLPVAQLRSFVIRDVLPDGLSCSEAPTIDLSAAPYSAGGFVPGGSFVPVCDADEVRWEFGDQVVTAWSGTERRFDFITSFIARVDNASGNRDGDLILNGGTATVAEVAYIDESNNPVSIPFDVATLEVREPEITLTKAFSMPTVDADDVPRVLVTATNDGSATAYNLRILDDLTTSGLEYRGDLGGTDPPTAVDVASVGANAPIFSWGAGSGIAPGDSISFSFAVHVPADTEPHTEFPNTIQADWTSLPATTTALNAGGSIGPDGSPTGMRIGALPNAADDLNDYESEVDATVAVPALAFDKVDGSGAQPARVGSHRAFDLVIDLPEGVSQNVSVSDDLFSGAVSYTLADNADFDVSYDFTGIAAINGQPPAEAALLAVPSDGTQGVVTWSVGTVTTQTEDDAQVSVIAPQIRISYFARIENDLATNSGETLRNGAALGYTNGETGAPEALADATAPVTVVEPVLSVSKALANVSVGKAAGDPPAFGDTLEYTISSTNTGNTTAYDVNIRDDLPEEMTLLSGFTPTATIDGSPVSGFVPTPGTHASGDLLWGAGNGDLTIDVDPGSTLELRYRVELTTPLPDPSALSNVAYVDWTSLDQGSVYERTGDGCPSVTAPDDHCAGPASATGTTVPLPTPGALTKAITQSEVAVGERFTYEITVPATPYAFPIYDVRIRDDLGFATRGVDLRFLDVTKLAGSADFTPQNSGTATQLLIEDATEGIDIPAGEQVTLEIGLVLEDTANNLPGVDFTNSADYTYNWVDDDDASVRAGAAGTSAAITIIGPDTIEVIKSGPSVLNLGAPGRYTLDVQNQGSGPAWNLTLLDELPDLAPGGTCDAAPTIVDARVFAADRTTDVSGPLVEGTDFTAVFAGEPDCTLTLSFLSPSTTVAPTQRLIVLYDVALDFDTPEGSAITNVAGATEWFSADGSVPATASDRRTFARALSTGTPGTSDHEDTHTASVALPLNYFSKTVANLTSPASPASEATPGDVLEYTITIQNAGTTAMSDFTFRDELDALNATPAFVPGSLANISVVGVVGADSSASDASGGASGTGLVDVSGLNLPNNGDSLTISYQATLATVLPDGMLVADQAELLIDDERFALSDDPNVNGVAQPTVVGDEDPTQLQIVSAPDFVVEKISEDVTGDPATLLAGETLRYTITVKNVGTDDAVDATLRDAVPVNTAYVPGSTTLNGAPVSDAAGSTSPLIDGLLLNAPEDATPGALRADGSATPDNVATITFDVVVDATVADGTVISNQAFVSAVTGGVVDQPSDDPDTALPDDPTRDVVGNAPLLFAAKSVVIQDDQGSVGVVDPGDRLRYTIAVTNSGAIPATAATLVDAVPADTMWVSNSLMLNGQPVVADDGGASPLASGIDIGSSDRPMPTAGAGTLSPGETATVVFDLLVDPSATPGTLISNQALVSSAEVANLLTDGDGDPTTGPEPTVVVVGAGQQLAIDKTVSVVGGGEALAGSELEYVVRVTNIGTVPATSVVIVDDLDAPAAGQLTYVADSALMNGAATGTSFVGSVLSADYGASQGALPPGGVITLRFRANIAGTLNMGDVVINEARVDWNSPVQSASASVSIAVGGMPGVAALGGGLWHDIDLDRVLDAGEPILSGWQIQLERNGQPLLVTRSDAQGDFRLTGFEPNDLSGDAYVLRFIAPDAGPESASVGRPESPFTNEPQRISDLVLGAGSNLQGINLPIAPNGVVYDSIQRLPVEGATVRLTRADTGALLPTSCFDDPFQQGQVTRGDGHYKFDLNFSDVASCPDGGDYIVEISAPAEGYVDGYSTVIPPTFDAATQPLAVPSCALTPLDAVPGTSTVCESQTTAFAPDVSVLPRTDGTTYHVHLNLDGTGGVASSQIFNNHIPLDPQADTGVAIVKTTPRLNVAIGDLVPYEIVVSNELNTPIPGASLVDRFPAGFKYVEGSARIEGVKTEPTRTERTLRWDGLDLDPRSQIRLALLLAVGAGVREGEFTNYAQVLEGGSDLALTGSASATVRVTPDPEFACTDVLGKVFDDRNRNGTQDEGEAGLPGVRLITARGLAARTDANGRFHITCALVPHERRGSNFVLKLDDRTLPVGYRLSTPQTLVRRATRGKAIRFNFGASIDRVVGLDLADAAFEPGAASLRTHWRPRIDRLVEELAKAPSTLRLSYAADTEDPSLIQSRLDTMRALILEVWAEVEGGGRLRIETEVVSGRRAEPVDVTLEGVGRGLLEQVSQSLVDAEFDAVPPLARTERALPTNEQLSEWVTDPERLAEVTSDRLESRPVVREKPETRKLRDVVPPIRFASGAIEIPPSSIDKLREVLASLSHLRNVRVHLVGHADDRPLSGELARRYGDNTGLSRERAGEVAELMKDALSLPAEAISFAGAGAAAPIASNRTEQGRRQNRRVEVEVWYDEIGQALDLRDVVVPSYAGHVKVCRVETVCKMRFKEGHARRTRIRNLVPPLHLDPESVSVPQGFIDQIREALAGLDREQEVQVKLIGHTDDSPLGERAARIYGDATALSKARARRVALAVQDALGLPNAAITSDGRGATRPVASNATERGRGLNRRIEVEFWHDDPLQELPEEPTVCPDAGDPEMVTQVFDPPWGRLEVLEVRDGDPVIPDGYLAGLRRALSEVGDRDRARLRFVGYVRNERLDRRTALAYGDDIGLSAARARRARALIQERMGLSDDQVEHEGHGFLHSGDPVNTGFIQGERSEIRVQVVYDEPAERDDLDGLDITRLQREVEARNPLDLNLLRITVDGEPIDDPGRSSADIQRCTDVAMDRTDIRFRFDDLLVMSRLAVSAAPLAIAAGGEPGEVERSDGEAGIGASDGVRFRAYTSYQHFIDRMEVRIFDEARSTRDQPLDTVEIDEDGLGLWRPVDLEIDSPRRPMKYVLRAYDAEGRFDETAAQPLWVVSRSAAPAKAGPSGGSSGGGVHIAAGGMFPGYGEAYETPVRNIQLGNVGVAKVEGRGARSGSHVFLAGRPVPVDEEGAFAAEQILPAGLHTVEVAVQDDEGHGELFLRDLALEERDWFWVGIADFTFGDGYGPQGGSTIDPQNPITDLDSNADGRLAFFLTGKFGDDWKLTASADTREGSLESLFDDFLDKSPGSLFRRIDPDYYYPTFGDDGTVEELAPTMGKVFFRISKDQNELMWGNYNIDYLQNELTQVQRGLYGGHVRWQSDETTSFGERRYAIDGFAADPGTVSTREVFRGTGGSLYYLRRSDLTIGSERLRIEIRDRASGLVTGVVELTAEVDYDIDYLQGRILLSEPLPAIVDDDLLVRSGAGGGDEAWLVVQYEYAPGFDEVDGLEAGGQAHYWLGDWVKLGATASRSEEGEDDSSLFGADLTLRHTARSWAKFQFGRSEGRVTDEWRSDDGGFGFIGTDGVGLGMTKANAYRGDVSLASADYLTLVDAQLTAYAQQLDAGYTAPGLTVARDTLQFGGTFGMEIVEGLQLSVKLDWLQEDRGLETAAQEADLIYQISEHWSLAAGVRNDERKDGSAALPTTQELGRRTDAVVEVGYDPKGRWRAYAFGQGTVSSTGNREKNNRYGAGGAVRITEKLELDGEVSHGDQGPAARIGSGYQHTEATRLYLTYALESERDESGSRRRGNLTAGSRGRFADSASVFVENRYTHSNVDTGLVQAAGMTWSPADRWALGANLEVGTLTDRRTAAETRRRAVGGDVTYQFDEFNISSGVEYRYDDTEQLDGSRNERTTWLFKNALRMQLSQDWRLLGKFNHSFSESSQGNAFDGGYTEIVTGYAYRPVSHDRLNALAKYTYFSNTPAPDQVTGQDVPNQFVQRSHIASLDVDYDITSRLSLGGKYAFRMGQVSLSRTDPEFFDNSAHLYILRSDYRFFEKWEGLVEGRMLHLPSLDERRAGALLSISRHLGDHFKVGVGYNFTDFSEDLTDLSYDHHGWFLNLVGSF